MSDHVHMMIAMPPNYAVSQVIGYIKGQRFITGDTALRLGHYFGSSPQFWLHLQAIYELRIAEAAVGRKVQALLTLNGREAA